MTPTTGPATPDGGRLGAEVEKEPIDRRKFLIGGGIAVAGVLGAVALSSVRSGGGGGGGGTASAGTSAGAGLGDGADEVRSSTGPSTST